MLKLYLIIILLFIVVPEGISQGYYKIKISHHKIKFTHDVKADEVFDIDSVQSTGISKIFYLSGAEKNVVMEFRKKERIVRLMENVDGMLDLKLMEKIELDGVAINDSRLK